jgi:hypothetical protein
MLCRLVDGRFPTEIPADGPPLALQPGGGRLVVAFNDHEAIEPPVSVDVIFPVLHGPFRPRASTCKHGKSSGGSSNPSRSRA